MAIDLNDNIQTREKVRNICCFSILLFLVCHGYRLVNLMYSHDSLRIVQDDYLWQIEIGRYLQPVLVALRGNIVAPLLIVSLQLLWIAGSVLLLTCIFNVTDRCEQAMISGLLVSNTAVTLTNATYLPWSDFFAFSMFCSVLAVAVFEQAYKRNNAKLFILSGALILIVLSTYQAYICFTMSIVLIQFFFSDTKNEKWKSLLLNKLKNWCVIVLAAGVLYYCIWKLLLGLYAIQITDSYNGLGNMSSLVSKQLIYLVSDTYKTFLVDVWRPMTFSSGNNAALWIVRVINIAAMIVCVISAFYPSDSLLKCIRISIILLFPLVVYFVKVLSGGLLHDLMKFSFVSCYLLFIFCSHEVLKDKKKRPPIILIMIALLVWNNIVLANQVYVKKALQEEATHSFVTSLITRIENTEGYESGQTQVVFAGSIEESKNIESLYGFEKIKGVGFGNSMITYRGTLGQYLRYVVNSNMAFTEVESSEITDRMTVYPDDGSIESVDGIIYVKLSD